MHFLQQYHTHSNKATPPNSATPYEVIGASYIQTKTHVMINFNYIKNKWSLPKNFPSLEIDLYLWPPNSFYPILLSSIVFLVSG